MSKTTEAGEALPWSAGPTRPEEQGRNLPPALMFVGSINADLRSILAGLAPAWRGLPVYVGCSGNFTVERILAAHGLTDLHGNDVSLYSCALGAYLSDQPFRVEVQDGDLAWLGDWLQPGLPTLATLLLCTTILDFHGRDNPYHRSMWNAYLRRWPDLHAKTLTNLEKGLAGLSLRGFFAGDVVDFFADAPEESVVISFPPTYKGGYERLYKKLQAAFAWNEPAYQLFTVERFQTLLESMTSKQFWCISRDEPVPALADHAIGRVQTSLRSKPVYVYANVPAAVLTQPRQRLADVPYPRLSAPPVERPATIITLSQEQLNTLRSEYLSPSIVPARVMWAFGLLLGGRLAGAFAFASPLGPVAFGDVYMTSDFAVQSSVPRLSKLVLACILSTEVRDILEQKLAQKVRSIGTTAFTDKPVSMKYRGVFDLHSRKEGRLNYLGEAGKWTLEVALTWWQKTQQRQP